MAFPVAHMLVPMLCVDLYRRYLAKKRFSYWWVLLAGFIGLGPDFDIFFSVALGLGRLSVLNYHRSFSHSLFVILALVIVAVAVYLVFSSYVKNNKKSKKTLKTARYLHYSYFALYIIAFAVFTHILLDFLDGHYRLLYPLDIVFPHINIFMGSEDVAATFDGFLLILWLVLQENVWEPIIERFNRILNLK
ncbi:TPA: metal-dependent hydrolase [Candidatus Woesearchaeota archaeon]|nr:metal-dependent hydrolase [Candidatus Woesearchaeota archaeon]